MRKLTPVKRANVTWEEGEPFFPAEPPPWLIRALVWLLIALFAAVLIASIVVHVPETVASRFVLTPEGGADPIQTPQNAVIEEVIVREGETVTRGQKLFTLRPLTDPNHLVIVSAPYDAVCIDVAQRSAGRVVAAGDELCQLNPTRRRLQARLLLPESGLSRVAPHQRVRFLFDAFPYQRYGVVNGSLDWISPAAVAHGERSDFVGIASMETSEIRSGGAILPLRAGMKGEARITVGRRALIEFLFEPLRKVRENLQS